MTETYGNPKDRTGMMRISTSKSVAILLALLFGMYLAVPNLLSVEQREAVSRAAPGWIPGILVPDRAVVLGLDLQGGSHVLLQVDTQGVAPEGSDPGPRPGPQPPARDPHPARGRYPDQRQHGRVADTRRGRP